MFSLTIFSPADLKADVGPSIQTPGRQFDDAHHHQPGILLRYQTGGLPGAQFVWKEESVLVAPRRISSG